MSDIDFDELDREVNKLVNNASVAESATQPKVADDSTTTPETDSTETQTDNDTIEMSSDEVQDGSSDDPVVTTRPRGRFMDVVHPSSDMSSSSGGESGALTSTPDRKALTPLTVSVDEDIDDSSEDSKVTTPNDVDEAQQNDTDDHLDFNEETDNGNNDENQNSTDMPDPIAVHEARQAEEKSSEENTGDDLSIDDTTEEDSSVEGAALAAGIPGAIDDPEEVPTPFVSDSKVEKRPLGQYSDEEKEKNVAEGLSKAIDTKIDEAITEASGTKGEEASPEPEVLAPLPPELEKDLVAIEAGESPDDILSGPSDESEKPTDTPEEQKDSTESDPEGSRNASEKENSAAALLASGSIPQQYKLALQKKAGVEGDTGTSQLFNAEHYATGPSKQGAKHHSKIAVIFQWVLIVVGVLLLGASIGAGLYVFVSNQ